jgi:hypothetical protein
VRNLACSQDGDKLQTFSETSEGGALSNTLTFTRLLHVRYMLCGAAGLGSDARADRIQSIATVALGTGSESQDVQVSLKRVAGRLSTFIHHETIMCAMRSL